MSDCSNDCSMSKVMIQQDNGKRWTLFSPRVYDTLRWVTWHVLSTQHTQLWWMLVSRRWKHHMSPTPTCNARGTSPACEVVLYLRHPVPVCQMQHQWRGQRSTVCSDWVVTLDWPDQPKNRTTTGIGKVPGYNGWPQSNLFSNNKWFWGNKLLPNY